MLNLMLFHLNKMSSKYKRQQFYSYRYFQILAANTTEIGATMLGFVGHIRQVNAGLIGLIPVIMKGATALQSIALAPIPRLVKGTNIAIIPAIQMDTASVGNKASVGKAAYLGAAETGPSFVLWGLASKLRSHEKHEI